MFMVLKGKNKKLMQDIDEVKIKFYYVLHKFKI